VKSLAVLALLAGTALGQEEPATTVEVNAGMGAVVSEKAKVVPHADIIVDAAVWAGRETIGRLRASVKLLGSEDGTAVNLRDVRTFNGVEANFEFLRRVGSSWDGKSETMLGFACGFATRRDSEGLAPNERFPTWCEGEVAVQHRDEKGVVDRRLAVVYGGNTMSTERWSPRVAGLRASAKLVDIRGVGLVIGLDMHKPVYGPGRGFARVTSSVAMSF